MTLNGLYFNFLTQLKTTVGTTQLNYLFLILLSINKIYLCTPGFVPVEEKNAIKIIMYVWKNTFKNTVNL